MKVYIIDDRDIEELMLSIKRDPARPAAGLLNADERAAYADAYQFYSNQLRTWIAKIQESKT